MSDGVRVNIGNGWMYLRKVIFHKLDQHRWDRKGAIATLFFESFPNTDYHQALMTFTVRAITALINPAHTLMDLENYSYAEMNHCWVYYGLCLNEDREECQENKWIPVRVDHKYWSDIETFTFTALVATMAKRYGVKIVDQNDPFAG